jgi:hypothetical protein
MSGSSTTVTAPAAKGRADANRGRARTATAPKVSASGGGTPSKVGTPKGKAKAKTAKRKPRRKKTAVGEAVKVNKPVADSPGGKGSNNKPKIQINAKPTHLSDFGKVVKERVRFDSSYECTTVAAAYCYALKKIMATHHGPVLAIGCHPSWGEADFKNSVNGLAFECGPKVGSTIDCSCGAGRCPHTPVMDGTAIVFGPGIIVPDGKQLKKLGYNGQRMFAITILPGDPVRKTPISGSNNKFAMGIGNEGAVIVGQSVWSAGSVGNKHLCVIFSNVTHGQVMLTEILMSESTSSFMPMDVYQSLLDLAVPHHYGVGSGTCIEGTPAHVPMRVIAETSMATMGRNDDEMLDKIRSRAAVRATLDLVSQDEPFVADIAHAASSYSKRYDVLRRFYWGSYNAGTWVLEHPITIIKWLGGIVGALGLGSWTYGQRPTSQSVTSTLHGVGVFFKGNHFELKPMTAFAGGNTHTKPPLITTTAEAGSSYRFRHTTRFTYYSMFIAPVLEEAMKRIPWIGPGITGLVIAAEACSYGMGPMIINAPLHMYCSMVDFRLGVLIHMAYNCFVVGQTYLPFNRWLKDNDLLLRFATSVAGVCGRLGITVEAADMLGTLWALEQSMDPIAVPGICWDEGGIKPPDPYDPKCEDLSRVVDTCKPRLATWPIGPSVEGCTPVVFRSCVHNDIAAVRTRVTKIQAIASKDLWYQVSSWVSATRRVKHLMSFKVNCGKFDDHFEAWSFRYPAHARKRLIRAREQVQRAGVRESDMPLVAFIKVERLPSVLEYTALDVKKPRLIQGRSDVVKVATGPYFWHLGKELAAMWSITSPICYASGVSAEDLGSWAAEQENRNLVPLCFDFSAWDSTVSKWAQLLWLRVLQRAGAPREVLQVVKRRLTPLKGRTKNGVTYTKLAQVSSGDGDTSVGNSFIQGVCWLWMLSQLGIDWVRDTAVIVLGDDCTLAVPQRHKKDIEIYCVARWKELGMKVKTFPSSSWDEATFCSGFFWRNGNTRVWGPNPGRVLGKTYWSIIDWNERKKPMWIRGLCMGLSKTVSCVPVLAALNKRLLELVGDGRVIVRRDMHDRIQAIEEHTLDLAAFTQLSSITGISVSTLKLMHQEASEIYHTDHCFRGDRWRELVLAAL